MPINFPQIVQPMVDKEGKVTPPWKYFLEGIFNRTGGTSGATGPVSGPTTSVVGDIAVFSNTAGNGLADSNINLAGSGSLHVTGTSAITGTNTGDQVVPAPQAAVPHYFVNSYNNSTGAFTVLQPDFTDLTGTATPAQLPIATSSAFGAVKPDNTSITISGGVITANTAGTVTGVGLSTDAYWLTVGSSPITSSGTISLDRTTGLAAGSLFVATPALGGSPGPVDLRAIINADLPTSAVTPGSYTVSSITVNSKGVVTAASSPTSGVVAGTYNLANISVNSQGIVTAASNGSGSLIGVTYAIASGNLLFG